MIKVDRAEENVCNSCMGSNAYKILCMTNEHNGCALYLCETCMRRLLEQVDSIKLGEELERRLKAILEVKK